MSFDWTITIGNIFTVGGFCVAGVTFVLMMRSDLRLFGQRIERLENDIIDIEIVLKSVSEAMRTMASTQAMAFEMDKRIDAISRRLDGYISNQMS